MQQNQSDDQATAIQATTTVVRTGGSLRVNPQESVRAAVGMTPDEPWAWYWYDAGDDMFVRRAGATLSGIPNAAVPVGVADLVEHGRNRTFAIPPDAIDAGGFADGQRWRVHVVDDNTVRMERVDDDE